jgi:uncharacterized protein (TIGR03435 family)
MSDAIKVAYNVQPYERVIGADQAVSQKLEERFEFNAKPSPASGVPTADQTKAMARQLLSERFGLKVRMDSEPVSATVLRMIRPGVLGPGVRPAPDGCTPLPAGAVGGEASFNDAYLRSCVLTFFQNRIRGTATLDDLARLLSFGAQHPFLNKTELAGLFTIDIEVARTSWIAVVPTRGDDGPALRDALRDQVGLDVRTERQAIRLLVVEHVGPLIEN